MEVLDLGDGENTRRDFLGKAFGLTVASILYPKEVFGKDESSQKNKPPCESMKFSNATEYILYIAKVVKDLRNYSHEEILAILLHYAREIYLQELDSRRVEQYIDILTREIGIDKDRFLISQGSKEEKCKK